MATNLEQKRPYWRIGEPMVWLTGSALTLILLFAFGIILVIMMNGLGVFWPVDVVSFDLENGRKVMGEVKQEQVIPQKEIDRIQLKIGNRDLYPLDFKWIQRKSVTAVAYPAEVFVLEREEYGKFYGFLKEVRSPSGTVSGTGVFDAFEKEQERILEQHEIAEELQDDLISMSREMERNRLTQLELKYDQVPESDDELQELIVEEQELKAKFEKLVIAQSEHNQKMSQYVVLFADVEGKEREIEIKDIVRSYQPNQMSFGAKVGFYLEKIGELLTDEPREANTEGGLFPAIIGTVTMVFTMSIFAFPLGVMAAVYLAEYAKKGPVVRLVRIAVNNLAGIPSIVYGVFGLGFFVYGVGGSIDALFFPERAPEPVFGTGGVLWASLTLSILTLPVVIVATEEALGSLPKGLREASLALGATKLQTLIRVVLPVASPGILTGFILAMARAAGEVAPLMITGVVKLAPSLPVDGSFPYIHLERKFMHLGFHIYDVGFQSPNVEAAKPMVFVTTLLLMLIVLALTSSAIYLRNQMRKRYAFKAF